jgi:hypothetical protein
MRFIIILSLLIALHAISETAGINKSSQSVSRIRQVQNPQRPFSQSKKILPKILAQKTPQTKPAPRRIIYDFAFFFDNDVNFTWRPVTFSAHPDSVQVKFDRYAFYNLPYFDSNDNGTFDRDTEWGWFHGVNRLNEVFLNDPIPLVPPCPGLKYNGDIHANGNILLTFPLINGKGSATGEVLDRDSVPFENGPNHYIRYGYTNHVNHISFPNIPTHRDFWEARALIDTTVHIITEENVDLFPGWILNGEFEGTPIFVWEGTEPIPGGIFFLTGHVNIEGNSMGNATIVTDHIIRVSGDPSYFEAGGQIRYIAGGNIDLSGGQYVQGLLYTKRRIFLRTSFVFGAVYSKEGRHISGNYIVIASGISLPVIEPVSLDIKPESCPNPLNTKSKGVLPTAILGTIDFDVTTLDTSSLRLNGVSPIRNSTEDVAAPVSEPSDPCDCTGEGPDGFLDLTLKFRTQDIVEAIGEVEDGDTVVLTLTGNLIDGTFIDGRDCIVILEKGKEKAIASQISPKPKAFALNRNQPNPFHSSTKIKYTLPAISNHRLAFSKDDKYDVKLVIYDVSGRLVETMVDERQEPGVYQIPISNNQLPGNGVYFYRLEAKLGQKVIFIATRKMILLK